MSFRCLLPGAAIASVLIPAIGCGGRAIAQFNPITTQPLLTQPLPAQRISADLKLPELTASEAEELCGTPALARLQRHTVTTGETLESVANRYGLTAATVMGFNDAVRNGRVAAGQSLIISPYNGIQVAANGRTWEKISAQYKVRADILFEVNGCVTQPTMAFIPGVKWVPGIETATLPAPAAAKPAEPAALSGALSGDLSGYPLRNRTTSLLNYGSNLDASVNQGAEPGTEAGDKQVVFHGGVDLAATLGDAVLSIGKGTVAYAADQGEYGNLIVINHPNGLQSRYAQLGEIRVKVGQGVDRNTVIGAVGQTGTPSSAKPHLHFEIRSNSALGWVAQDPMPFLGDRPGAGQASP